MLIKVQSVDKVRKQSKAGKPYTAIEVLYESDGRNSKYTVFPSEPIAVRVLELVAGNFYDVRVVKDGDFFKWTEVTDTTAPVVNSQGSSKEPPARSPGSTYSTKEEREETQNKIVRQFAINAAINLLKNDKKAPDVKDVKATAEQFVDFVYNETELGVSLKDIEDDIPL